MDDVEKFLMRALAEAERMMDDGRLSWVMAPSPINEGQFERLPVSEATLKEFGLVKGQKINSLILDGIHRYLINKMEFKIDSFIKESNKIKDDEEEKEVEKKLDPNFDFRKMI